MILLYPTTHLLHVSPVPRPTAWAASIRQHCRICVFKDIQDTRLIKCGPCGLATWRDYQRSLRLQPRREGLLRKIGCPGHVLEG